MEYQNDILRILPNKIIEQIRNYIGKDDIEEIRLKVSKPIILNSYNNEYIIDYLVAHDDIKYIMVKISNYSLYAFEQQIKQGYITMKGGHRIGLAGECVMENGEIKTIRNISSVNIRMCKEIIGASKKVMPYIVSCGNVLNTLIISPPKCGKTTMLRDITKNISNGSINLNLAGKKVTVIDERSEIAACYNGVPQMNVGIRTDVLDCCPKAAGMMMLIRSMSPQVIAVDEIGTPEDVHAIEYAMHCGCKMLATVHAESMEELRKKPLFNRMIGEGRFERYILLGNNAHVGQIEGIFDNRGSLLYKEALEMAK